MRSVASLLEIFKGVDLITDYQTDGSRKLKFGELITVYDGRRPGKLVSSVWAWHYTLSLRRHNDFQR
jgi:hypothetical protein